MSEPKRVQKRNGVQGIEKEITLQVSKDYCAKNGLSLEKLKNQLLFIFDNSFVFAAPSDIVANGLVNDIASQPLPVLMAEMEDGRIIFHQTEYTRRYIAN